MSSVVKEFTKERMKMEKEFVRVWCHRQQWATLTGAFVSPLGSPWEGGKVPDRLVHKPLTRCR